MWDDGGGYERFMGRWSRRLARRLVADTLAAGVATGRWLDVGCGTGAVTAACLAVGAQHVDAVDPSPAFVAAARTRFADDPVSVHRGDAVDLAGLAGPYDAALSALVLNFTPDPVAALRAIRAVLGPSGRATAAVWHYADDRSFLGRFWQAVEDVLGRPAEEDERHVFEVCTPAGLRAAATAAGWDGGLRQLDVATTFADATDLWEPFLAGIGPSGRWATSQPADLRDAVRDRLVGGVFQRSGEPAALPFRALVVDTGGAAAGD